MLFFYRDDDKKHYELTFTSTVLRTNEINQEMPRYKLSLKLAGLPIHGRLKKVIFMHLVL